MFLKNRKKAMLPNSFLTLISLRYQKKIRKIRKKLQAHLIDENELKILNKNSSKAVPVVYKEEKHELWNYTPCVEVPALPHSSSMIWKKYI